MSRMDIQQVVTDRIIAMMEAGGLKAWQMPWQKLGQSDRMLPYNFSTNAEYRGVNTWNLLGEAIERGFTSNGWLTFNQAKAFGGTVRKGEKGTLAVKYLVLEKKGAEKEEAREEDDQSTYACLKGFYLFNLDQIEGIERPDFSPKPIPSEQEMVLDIERLVERQVQTSGLTYSRFGDRAFYRESQDLIAMPVGEFASGSHYAATLAHELVHATKNSKRLGRTEVVRARFSFHEEAYAFEELVAELGAAMICAEHGIIGDHLQHESYIASWLEVLKKDKTYIFKAAKLAADAHCFIMPPPADEAEVPMAA